MFNWLIIYAEKFGKEFPLRLFSGKREYEVLQLVMDCCNSGQPYPEPEPENAPKEPENPESVPEDSAEPENVPEDPAEDLPAEAELEAQEAPAVQEPEPPKKRTRKAK